MHIQHILFHGLLAASAMACAPAIHKRAAGSATPWAYDRSYDWGELDPAYELCQTGTMQAPIPLRLDQGLSTRHVINFSYVGDMSGHYYNWGYGPAFELAQKNITTLPKISFVETDASRVDAYLASWHIHAPADHTVQGDRSKAELHFVHVDTQGNPRAVLAFRIDPGLVSYSKFIGQLPFNSSRERTETATFPNFNMTKVTIDSRAMNLNMALAEVSDFNEFWTYKGSLTSPPCREGVRFFVARQILFTSNEQMQDILRISRFSARQEQEVWMHEINL